MQLNRTLTTLSVQLLKYFSYLSLLNHTIHIMYVHVELVTTNATAILHCF